MLFVWLILCVMVLLKNKCKIRIRLTYTFSSERRDSWSSRSITWSSSILERDIAVIYEIAGLKDGTIRYRKPFPVTAAQI